VAGLHGTLAFVSAVVIAFTGVEGAVRAWVSRPPGILAARATALVLLLLAMTIAGGLGLWLSGRRPHESLHFIYALLAFGTIPIAHRLSNQAPPRTQGLVSVGVAVLGIGLIARLIATG
jgi:hypothetical protein